MTQESVAHMFLFEKFKFDLFLDFYYFIFNYLKEQKNKYSVEKAEGMPVYNIVMTPYFY